MLVVGNQDVAMLGVAMLDVECWMYGTGIVLLLDLNVAMLVI